MEARTWGCAAVLLFVPGAELATDYSKPRALRITAEFEMRTESTTQMERDGETSDPMTSSSSAKRSIVQVDTLVEHDGGAPTKVRRAYETLKSESSMSFGDQERSDDRDGALAGVTLELTRGDDGEVEVKVVEGSEPESASLEGHKLELALDALLPDGDKGAGEEWKPDNDAVRRALGLDLTQALFPPPQMEAPEGGGEGGGRRRGGRGPGGSTSMLMQLAEWECVAKLAEGDEDFEGATCAVIELELTAEGSLPETAGGPGGGRMLATPRALENSYEIKLTGKLLFDRAARMPVHLSLEGEVSSESHMERTWNDQTMKFDTETSGEIAYEVTLALEKSE